MTERPKNLTTSETRNSKLRELTASPIQLITQRLHEAFPSLEPNHITAAGIVGTAIGSLIALDGNQKAASLPVLCISAGLDAFDGALARRIEAESPGSVDFKKGAVYDSISDRTQELVMALSRAVSANKKGSTLGKALALLNAVSNSLPSTAKAFAETKGVVVPENGRGPKGVIGTRVGRAVLGIASTVFPEVKSVPTQIIADAIVTSANIATAIERADLARKETGTLAESDRADARVRFKALALFTAIAVGTSAITYIHLKNRKSEKSDTQEKDAPSEDEYLQIISDIESYCRENELDHRFVGGTVTDLIGPETEFQIDVAERRIKLINANKPRMIREDGSVKDMDLVVFTKSREEFLRAKSEFERKEAEAKTQNKPFPQISIESAYQPDWPKRNKLKQFVSAFEFNQNGSSHLAFGDTTQEISPETLQPWTINIDGWNQITVFNPVAHRLCYELRVPSGLKPKDVAKMPPLENFAYAVITAGLDSGIDYRIVYNSWWTYIQKLQRFPDPLTKVKGKITEVWWKTLGTSVTHGKGMLGNLSRFNNKMNG
ncbi:hypothetical protein A3H83_00010 [Candidatus Roizmanbacteria bacterium RIFCSPLOWO2_02_FULL_39_8]|uniref:Uncharacterized protein n=1 Tax=Candidatus Curtissbacteria bacterium RIFCSPHIGHO2_01_FULL_40_12 TaxID=1797710 RepID=A0A1F5G5T9_9BACT|nr:MAG: hypothetical protein A2693_05075 [Candidatus Curtissbacteria bacterium RIFCSPHIGHO2_01_FULL_40_12]OGK56618.1 MAG: hypothetical protein A3H83_00010 [Candidatus Roizmanbacteria bacterium RIFCSPLOWO2_02_FULL_39_8]